MVGQGVLRECLLDPDVESVLSVSRQSVHQQNPKFREIIHADLLNLSAIEPQLKGYDACFYCLGISSVGMNEQDYTRITYDFTVSVGSTLVKQNPNMVFVFVSGAGTAQRNSMWSRVKGKAEDALMKMPFKAAYMFRPGFIEPLHGITSKTKSYRVVYAIVRPLFPLLLKYPKYVTTTERIGRAMLRVVKQGFPKQILESEDINSAALLQ